MGMIILLNLSDKSLFKRQLIMLPLHSQDTAAVYLYTGQVRYYKKIIQCFCKTVR